MKENPNISEGLMRGGRADAAISYDKSLIYPGMTSPSVCTRLMINFTKTSAEGGMVFHANRQTARTGFRSTL